MTDSKNKSLCLSLSLQLLIVKLLKPRDIVLITGRIDKRIRARICIHPFRLGLHIEEACMRTEKNVAMQPFQDLKRSRIDFRDLWPRRIVHQVASGMDRHACYTY